MTNQSDYILILPKWYPNRLDFLDGNYIENHAVAISQYQRLVILFVRSDHNVSSSKLEIHHAKEHGMEVFRAYFKKANTGITMLDKIINLLRYVRSQFKAFKEINSLFGLPKITHIHVLTRTSALAWSLFRKHHIPYVISEHWSGYFPENGDYKGLVKKWITQKIVKNSAGVTTVSEYLKQAMLNHGLTNQYEIIPNVADTDVFQLKEKPKQQIKKILHVSGMSKIPKNVHSLIQVCHELTSERSDFELHMIGDGPEMSQRKKEALDLGLLDKQIFFYGDVPMDQVAKHMQESDFLVLCSIYENQPCVLIESISTGTPIIAPIIGGIPEHFTNNGVLIPKDNNHALKEAILKMLDESSNFDASALRSYAIKNFSHEVVGKQFSTYYQKILS